MSRLARPTAGTSSSRREYDKEKTVTSGHVAARRGMGVTRKVPDNTPMITFEHGQYSIPSTLLGQSVWVRHHRGTDEVIICALDGGGPIEVARHRRTTRGTPAIDDAHFPNQPGKIPGDYRIRARSAAEHAFLAIGDGAAVWLKEAAAVGTERIIEEDDPRGGRGGVGRSAGCGLGVGSRRGARPVRHRRPRLHSGQQRHGPDPARRIGRHVPSPRHQRMDPIRANTIQSADGDRDEEIA